MKVVLGYSGGLDTSIIVPWLKEHYQAEVICMAANVGQNDDLTQLDAKAKKTGASALVVEDLRKEFVEDFAWPTLRAGAVYSRRYLLGTSMARPLIARRQVEVARRFGADALAHGCTGKGNDQVRFELTFAALAPDLQVIAPWREWDIRSREDALAYARARDIPLNVDTTKLYSRDENLWHISHEGGPLEDPANEPEEAMFQWTVSPEQAPDQAEYVEVAFENGTPVSLDGEALGAVALLERLNALGSRHGVGRADVIEDRLVGMKSRGVYETPGGTILYAALRELEAITLDRRSMALKDQLAPRYADLVYEGRWWTPERDALDAMVNVLLHDATGTVKMKLYKGNTWAVSRKSERSLYREDLATFGASTYDHADADGFIKLFSLPMRAAAARDAEENSAVTKLLREVAQAHAKK
ncbi:MAG: argininosuccinate synthase [Gemmatimonadetes bacterium]|nr:argininosuccinate synthase [Gemmatimonadota bacterium]